MASLFSLEAQVKMPQVAAERRRKVFEDEKGSLNYI